MRMLEDVHFAADHCVKLYQVLDGHTQIDLRSWTVLASLIILYSLFRFGDPVTR